MNDDSFYICVDSSDELNDTKSSNLENVLSQISVIYDSLTLFKMNINSIQQQLKVLEKDVKKEMKQIQKKQLVENVRSKRKPSGFAKPGNVSKELCQFMECEEGTKLARTQVTQYLFKYIKDNNLTQTYSEINEETGKHKKKNKIILDDKLKQLLGFENENENDENNITHFTIQKHMNKHFL